jgi:hypothetical protein
VRKMRLLDEVWGYSSITHLVSLPELVEVNQFGRQELAAPVALALLSINVEFSACAFDHTLPHGIAMVDRAARLPLSATRRLRW